MSRDEQILVLSRIFKAIIDGELDLQAGFKRELFDAQLALLKRGSGII